MTNPVNSSSGSSPSAVNQQSSKPSCLKYGISGWIQQHTSVSSKPTFMSEMINANTLRINEMVKQGAFPAHQNAPTPKPYHPLPKKPPVDENE